VVQFEGGEIEVVSNEQEIMDRLSEIGEESLVRISGELIEHRWSRGDGVELRRHQIKPNEIVVIRNARHPSQT